jgi:hypothetical protein
MSQCTDLQNNLTAWLDGELEEKQQTLFQQHLWACTSCQEALHAQQHERLWLKENDCEIEPRPEVWYRIQRTIREEAGTDRRSLGERFWNWLSPRPLPHLSRAWIGISLIAMMAVSGLIITHSYRVDPALDQEVRQSMESYVQWRQYQMLYELPGVNVHTASIDELRMTNPFIEEKNGKADSNPFEM